MSSFVEELQRDASDSNVKVADLVRRCLVAASRLKLREFEEWAERELYGYTDCQPPEYRKVTGQAAVGSPSGQYTPILLPAGELSELGSFSYEISPIGVLQELANGPHESIFAIPYSSIFWDCWRQHDYPNSLVPVLLINRIHVSRIVDAVKTTVTKWTVKLVEEGILGKKGIFSEKEKQKASAHAAELIPQIHFVFVGQMINSVIQQASPHAVQVPTIRTQ